MGDGSPVPRSSPALESDPGSNPGSSAGSSAPSPSLPVPEHDCAREARERAAVWSVAAEQLVAEAGWRTVEDLGCAARAVRDRLDPVGAERRYLARYEQRSFRMWRDRDGVTRGSIAFDDVSAAWLRSARDAALRPRRGGPRFVDPEEQTRARELIEDPRTNEQLEFDLLMDLLRAGTPADAETVFGTRQAGVRLVQIVDPADDRRTVRRGAGHFEDDPAAIPAGVVGQQTCASGVVPVTVDRSGRPLDVGRERRLYTARQRIALAVRDGGCRWPGCDRPPAYCEAHHIDEWQRDQGSTDLDRGILLCRFHHMQLHNGGWRITRSDDTDPVRDESGPGTGDRSAGIGGPDSLAVDGRADIDIGAGAGGRGGDGVGVGTQVGVGTRDGPGAEAGTGDAPGADTGVRTDDFALHDPGGRTIAMRPRIELRFAWGDLDPPRRRCTLAA